MFLNKAKEQLGPDKANVSSFPHPSSSSTSSPHYPTAVLALPGSMDPGSGLRLVPKQEGGGGNAGGGGGPMSAIGQHLHQSHTTQNVTVVPVPSTGIMTAGQWGTVMIFFLLQSQHHPTPFAIMYFSVLSYCMLVCYL